ncbi:hypothetical protein DSO57_1027235 [Entomophthora muscae]|uniref:Uncharacterized protein n=1 Tax=Entomophthora muscae TaxID=34485 RepID=A0ACC2RSZ3_9FUNG|nr:hypothetical protein DSO57_1027235 [Entomophthora muscae]
MSGLPPDWTPYTPGTAIPNGFVLYQNTVIPLSDFNAMSAQGFFQAPSSMPQPVNKTTMPAYISQRLQSAALEPFARANNNNAAAWIQSAQSKLAQMECPQQFWIAEISICLTHDAGTWCNKWHEEHTNKSWDIFKQDFLARFVLKDTALMIIRQVKNLTQTGTVVTKVTASKLRAGIKPAPSHQAGLAGGEIYLHLDFCFSKQIQVQEPFPPWWQLRGPLWAPKAMPKPWWVWLGLGRLFLAAQ